MLRLTFASVSEILSSDQLELTRITEKSAKYAVSFNGNRLFLGRTLNEVMQLFSDYQGTTINQLTTDNQPQETDDREFIESIPFSQSCDSDSFCTVASLPLLPEDIQTYPVTDLIAYIAACRAITKLFKEISWKKIFTPSNFKDIATITTTVRTKAKAIGFSKNYWFSN